MKFEESFSKLGAVPELDLKTNKKIIISPLYYAFLRVCGNANSFYCKGQIDGRRWVESGWKR